MAVMIRTESEYQEAIRRYKQDREVLGQMRAALAAQDLTAEEIETAIEPTLSYQAQLTEEISWYENVCRRNFSPSHRLTDLGRVLIALRIANGLTQSQMAQRLGVSAAVVSRDEKNEYHGITLERAQRILDALGEIVTATVGEPASGRMSFVSGRSPFSGHVGESDAEETEEEAPPAQSLEAESASAV